MNGTSIVENGVANVPLSSTDEFGVVKVIGEAYGVTSSEGRLFTAKANDAQVQNGTNNFKPIVPSNQHSATFYGLAKASGDATQIQSANPVGTYTDDAKEAIQNMLGVPSNDDVVDDVQINGTSIVNNGVANVPIGSENKLGVLRPYGSFGIGAMSDGRLAIIPAVPDNIKNANNEYRPVTSLRQHQSVFYGLAKASGDSSQSASSNPVGMYTEEAKIAIQKMLGIYEAPWELIREDTFTNAEEADHIISTDANGETFELIELFLMFETPTQATEAKKGSYGQVRYYYSETAGVSTEAGAWTNAANAQAKALFGYIKIDGGLLFSATTQPIASGSAGNWRTRYSNSFAAIGSMPQGIQYGDVIDSIKRINILAVTGTGHYKLYGRRKWQ